MIKMRTIENIKITKQYNNKRQIKPKGQPGMDDPETLATQDTRRRQTTLKTHTENQQDKQHVFHKRNPSARKQFLPLIRYQPCYS